MSRRLWTTIRVRTLSDRGAVIGVLFENGAEGVQEFDEEIVTHLAAPDRHRIVSAIHAIDAGASVQFAPTPEVDWSSEWKTRIRAHRVGQLVVTPPWLADQFTERERIVIEPAMAFGTGDHETTRGVIRLMQRVVRKGDTVADLGAGSAVLGIAAAKLGASRVVAIELDPDAIGNAEDNIRRNGVDDHVTVVEGDAGTLLPLVAPVRVVLANIISSVLIELLPTIARALTADGAAILSGILSDEKDRMESVFRQGAWRLVEADQEGPWWSASIVRY